MRIGALLFVGIGLTLALACNGPGPDDEECTAQGGACLLGTDQSACGEQLFIAAGVCPATFVCCLPAAGDAGAGSGTGAAPVADAGAKKD